MTGKRLLTRFSSFLFFLLLAEFSARTIVAKYPLQNFERAYRFPRGAEALYLPRLVEHIVKHTHDVKISSSPGKIIVFSGSSPTYGHKIKNPENTYPFAFENNVSTMTKKQHQRHPRVIRVYNTASDGQLISDQYFIVKSLVHAADIFYIQLNYHTFDPQTLRATPVRHKELPEMLGVPVTPEEASRLDRRHLPPFSANLFLQNFARTASVLYRERETLPYFLLGKKPEDALYSLYKKWSGAASHEKDDALFASSVPFSQLSPAKQLVIVKRYAERCHFIITPDNSEVYFLKRMTALLKQEHKPAVVFMTPLNSDALDAYEVMDWKQYKKNVRVISNIVTQNGFVFLDMNARHHYPEHLFFDISHTLDNGGQIVGRDLFNDTKAFLEKVL